MTPHLGEIAALITAACWTVTALSFEPATKKIGSVAVNLFKLVLGFLLLGFFNLAVRGHFLPLDATPQAWLWLSLSGLAGFVIGDYFLFKSYTVISARVAMLIMALAPPLAAVMGWLWLSERLSYLDLSGMGLTLLGISMVVLKKGEGDKPVGFKHPLAGILLALGGAAGQAGGLVLSKYGMQGYHPFASAQIRVLTGLAGFALLLTASGGWGRLTGAIRDRKLAAQLSLGTTFGPFLGVSFSLLAVQHTSTGVASTIMALVPVLIIPPSVFLFRHKINLIEITGAFVAVGGTALLFLK
jgi:drug/metabolite transporter (DMT)-like permease